MSDNYQEAIRLIEEVIHLLGGDLVSSLSLEDDPTRLKSLVFDPQWPEAVSTWNIVDPNLESDKIARATALIEMMIDVPLSGLRFLDFGCGEGHVVKKAMDFGTSFSLGYDIKQQGSLDWDSLLTTDLEKVKQNAPYDIVLIYDVLDHTEEQTPVEILRIVKELLSDTGKIYIRCHPWCSRHGGHLYEQGLNKAYAHLIFTEDELNQMGIVLKPNNKVLFPIKTYVDWLNAANLTELERTPDLRQVELFFKENSLVKNRIYQTFGRPEWDEFPIFQLEQTFVDFIVK